MRIKPGDEVTAVYNSLTDRHVLLLKVTKVGRKYIYGTTLWSDPDGAVREGHDTKVDTERSIIYPGLRHDLRAAEFKYQNDYRRWQDRYQEKEKEITRELRDLIRSRLDEWKDEWKQENPIPQRPELPTPEAEG